MEQITNLLAYGRQATNNIRRRRIKLKIFIHSIRYFLFSRAIMDSLLDPLRKNFPSVKLQNFWRDEVKILRNIQRIF